MVYETLIKIHPPCKCVFKWNVNRTEWLSSFLAPLLLEAFSPSSRTGASFLSPPGSHPRASQFLHLTDLSANTSLSSLGGQLLLGGTMSCSFLCPYSVTSEQIRVYSSCKTAYELPSPAHPESWGGGTSTRSAFLTAYHSDLQSMAIIWPKARFSLFLSTLSQGRATYFWP